MIHLSFQFFSTKRSQSKSVTAEATHSLSHQAIVRQRRNNRINWALGLLCVGWGGVLVGCSSSTVDTLGDWTQKSELEGSARYAAAGFTIGNIAYMGTGIDGNNQRLTDFWAYDPSKNAWTQKADFGGIARNAATGFGTSTKGYIGTGLDLNSTRLKDFWEYDPSTNKWVQIADFGGTARQSAVAFVIKDIGYVGTGYDGNYLKDFWSYDATKKVWAKVASYGGFKRVGAAAFVINNMAYVGLGNNNAVAQKDWYVYDPSQDVWTQKLDFTTDQSSIARSYAVGFTINGKGYITTGDASTKDVWEYDPTADTWTTRGVFEGSSRTYGIGFAIGSKGYVTTGKSGTSPFDDLWQFDPTIVQDLDN